jgi:hypothetical protein
MTNDNRESDFHELLLMELIIRNVDCLGALEELRERLNVRIEEEDRLSDTLTKIKNCEPAKNAFVAIIKNIPCSLHLEMTVVIKGMEMIVCTAIGNLPTTATKQRVGQQPFF